MNRLEDDEEYNDELTTDTSTLESLMIQAIMNQLASIVQCQNRKQRMSYDNQLKQAETLRSLTQSALMLTDGESLHIHGRKIQTFLNRYALETIAKLETNEPTH